MNFQPISEWSFDKRLQSSPVSQPQAIDLANNKDLSSSDIVNIVKYSHNLTSIVLENSANVTDKVVQDIVKECRVLTSLDLSSNNEITDSSVHSIATYSVMLTKLNLKDCPNVSGDVVFELVEKCRSLNTLDLTLSDSIDESIAEVIRSINPRVNVQLHCTL